MITSSNEQDAVFRGTQIARWPFSASRTPVDPAIGSTITAAMVRGSSRATMLFEHMDSEPPVQLALS